MKALIALAIGIILLFILMSRRYSRKRPAGMPEFSSFGVKVLVLFTEGIFFIVAFVLLGYALVEFMSS